MQYDYELLLTSVEEASGAPPPIPAHQPRRVPLLSGVRYAIGRGQATDPHDSRVRIEVSCVRISRTPLLLDERDGTWYLTTNGGTNPTSLNGVQLAQFVTVPLADDAKITVQASRVSFQLLRAQASLPDSADTEWAPTQRAAALTSSAAAPTSSAAASRAATSTLSVTAPTQGAAASTPIASPPTPPAAIEPSASEQDPQMLKVHSKDECIGCVFGFPLATAREQKAPWLRKLITRELSDTLPHLFPRGWVFDCQGAPVTEKQEKKLPVAMLLRAAEVAVTIRSPVVVFGGLTTALGTDHASREEEKAALKRQREEAELAGDPRPKSAYIRFLETRSSELAEENPQLTRGERKKAIDIEWQATPYSERRQELEQAQKRELDAWKARQQARRSAVDLSSTMDEPAAKSSCATPSSGPSIGNHIEEVDD